MQYLSPEFGLCFLVFLWFYWFIAARYDNGFQNFCLLIASYAFYACFSWHFLVLLILFSAVILGLAKLLRNDYGESRKWPVYIGVIYALCNLGLFKYYNFFREEANLIFSNLFQANSLPVLDIVMPVGISFYTFQGIAFLITLSREEREPPNWINGLLHLAFFPTLLAGPICRPNQLLNQIESNQVRQPQQVEFAFVLILLAMVKKVWLAGWLSNDWTSPIFASPDSYHPVELLCGLFAYAWQLFFDFSGYTDAVTAFALLLGFQLPKNFNQPYLAVGLADFWRRWHISLSSWIRDFVYIPLGGNRNGWVRTQINIIMAMVLSGIWHGASFTFVVWGFWHGIGLVAQNTWQKMVGLNLPKFFAIPLTFLFVSIGWLFFRAPDWSTVLVYSNAMTQWGGLVHTNWIGFLLALCSFFIFTSYSENLLSGFERLLVKTNVWLKIIILVVASALIIALSPSGMPGFIYFGF